MSFVFQGRNFQGATLGDLLPWMGGHYGPPDVARALKSYLVGGGKIYVEITEGARKGSIGRLLLSPDQDFYHKAVGGYYKDKWLRSLDELELEFDGRPQKIKMSFLWSSNKTLGHKLRFDVDETTWVFTIKPKVKTSWTPRDHFGTELDIGSMVLFTDSDGTLRFGNIQRWSDKGTMWVETIVTRKGQSKGIIHRGVGCVNMVLINKDTNLADKIMLAKLSQ